MLKSIPFQISFLIEDLDRCVKLVIIVPLLSYEKVLSLYDVVYVMKKLENKLEQKEVRPTAMRLLVLKALQSQKAAVSLQDLEMTFERADRITLYRTLKTFQEKGLVHSIEDGTGTTKYALCQDGCECAPEDMHVHFFCNSCNDTFCLPKFKIPSVSLPQGFVPVETNLLVKGICANCS